MDLNCLPEEGAASQEIQRQAQERWLCVARQASIDLLLFDPSQPLVERLAWARSKGYSIGVICARYSHKKSSSIIDQVIENIEFAARNKIYVPPEFICADEAVTGRKSRRAGLERAKLLMVEGPGEVLLLYKLSRLLRTCYKSVAFVQEEIIEAGRRAISVTQHVDTQEASNWRKLVYLYGLMDESLLDTIADHVRSNLKQLFENGYCVGGLTLGYDAVVVEGPLTKLGKPRKKPALNSDFKKMFNTHVDLHLGGMAIVEGWRLWVRNGGARDPRSKGPRMSYPSYRKMLSNPRYTGLWAFGQKRNVWLSKRECVVQNAQPDEAIILRRIEELRAIDDERFLRLQTKLAKYKLGPRSVKKKSARMLWDYTTEFFVCGGLGCEHHDQPYYQSGGRNPVMVCPSLGACPQHVVIRRDIAVRNICAELAKRLSATEDLVTEIIGAAILKDGDDSALRAEIDRCERRRQVLTENISGLLDLVGVGTPEDRRETKKRISCARKERQKEDLRLHSFQVELAHHKAVEPGFVRQQLVDFAQLMEDAGAGVLSEAAVHKAVRVFELLTGGRIVVEAVARPGRQRQALRAHFTMQIAGAVMSAAGCPAAPTAGVPVTVWIRPLPQFERLADEVHQLVDGEDLSFSAAADKLRERNEDIDQYGVERCYRRYYTLRGQRPPKRAYNNGHRRRSRNGTIAERFADEVKLLMDRHLPMREIAEKLNIRVDDVTAAKRHWYKSRGLPVPDGRVRRKSLTAKTA